MYFRTVFILGMILLLGIVLGKLFQDSMDAGSSGEDKEAVERYPLFDPEMAPPEILDQVMLGFMIMREPKDHLPDYSGNKLNCTNCHFSGGNSYGENHNGFSLVGVVHKYPRKLESGKEYTLAERMNSCFTRSLNGKPLPVDGPHMKALITYLEWISSGIPEGTDCHWLGMEEIQTSHSPDSVNGGRLYALKCAPCHGKDGQGQERPYELSYPPLWGENSFNDGAGMNKIETFACFVHHNMPYNEPTLSIEEALDVAAYVTSQPRPKLIPPEEQSHR